MRSEQTSTMILSKNNLHKLESLINAMSTWKWKQVIPLVAGILFISFGLYEVCIAHSSSNWKAVTGSITESKLIETKHGRRNRIYHEPYVAYVYSLNGEQFSSNRIIIGEAAYDTLDESSHSRSSRWLTQFPLGKEVTVYVNPENPRQSVLVRGMHQVSFFKVYLGLACFVAFAISIHPFFRKEESAPSF